MQLLRSKRLDQMERLGLGAGGDVDEEADALAVLDWQDAPEEKEDVLIGAQRLIVDVVDNEGDHVKVTA